MPPAADNPGRRQSADMRYLGQGFEVTVPLPAGPLSVAHEAAIGEAFTNTYRSVFGRTIPDGAAELINWRISAQLPAGQVTLPHPAAEPEPRRPRRVRFAAFGEVEVDVYPRYALPPGTEISGPALFTERETSCGVGPDCTVTVDDHRNLVVDFASGPP